MSQKNKLIFLNSPIRKSQTWKKVIAKLLIDNQISDRFEFIQLDISKIEYKDIGNQTQGLTKELSRILNENEEISILSHGITSLIIIEFILFMIFKEQWDELRKINQVIFFAPILFKEKNYLSKKKIITSVFNQKLKVQIATYKELGLIYNNKSKIPQIVEDFYKKIILANKFSNSQAMIPTSVIYDLKDSIVHRRSLEEIFDNCISADGVFNNLLELPNSSFIENLKEVLLNPRSHRSIFKVRNCSVHLDVYPLDKKKKIINDEEIILDHEGEIRIKLLFDSFNISKLKFLFRLSVSSNGNIEEYSNVRDYKNETDSSNIGRFEREGNEYILEFVPINSKNYRIALKAVNGFDDSQDWDRTKDAETFVSENKKRQYYQFPIGNGNKNFNTLQFNLSLIKYLKSGFNIKTPRLYYIPLPISFEYTDSYEIENVVINEHSFEEPTINKQGNFNWELSNIKRGTVLITWIIEKNKNEK